MIRYGIIGAGAMGREHIANLSFIDGAQVTAIADPSTDSLERAKGEVSSRFERADLQTFSDHRALLDSGLVDAVIIATPNFTHAALMKDALATDLHLFIEKPLCTTVEDCIEVIEASRDRAALVWMGLEYRYMPPVSELIKIVHSGGVGKSSSSYDSRASRTLLSQSR